VAKPELLPDIVYHYTLIESFKKILATGKIRATRYDQMNDMSEVQLGVEALLRAVESYKTDSSFDDYKKFLLSGIEGYKEDTLEVYVLSLSDAPDSLDQWRAYTPKGGVAIGFDRQMVQKGFLCDFRQKVDGKQAKSPSGHDLKNHLMRCLYTEKNGELDLRSIVAERFFKPNSFPAIYALDYPLAPQVFCASLSAMIYRTVCSIKHGAYASEREWRCVNYTPKPKVYPVMLSETNRLYIEMQFDPNEFIKEVWISPHGNSEACERAVTYIKDRYDLRFTIRRSTTPYRAIR